MMHFLLFILLNVAFFYVWGRIQDRDERIREAHLKKWGPLRGSIHIPYGKE